ncbi:MAG: GNAT family N-acetyltransferase [Candidatus Thiodiazotropha sp. (ex Myrtea sp. 'scaly one' KF741663)]|nr:GNAT family N-acetyltransferase [Candidatus Thiodiazotropha sp. (ex Myrtea sp. 'scaly one' KF741663)]
MKYSVAQVDILKEKEAIINFWNENNQKKLNEKFSWIYESNPDGSANVWLLTDNESSDIVGMVTLFPRNFEYSGKTYRAGILGDFYIQKYHRSFGPALMLIRTVTESFETLNFDFIYGFPNTSATPVLRRAGFTQLGRLVKYVRLFNIERLLQSKIINSTIITQLISIFAKPFISLLYPDTWNYNYGRYNFSVSNSIHLGINDLIDNYNETCFSTQKSYKYLNWKYEQDPDDDNIFFNMFDKHEKCIGCVVFRLDSNTVEIRELIHTDNPRQTADLLSGFFKYVKRKKAEYAYLIPYENSCILSLVSDLQLSRGDRFGAIVFLTNKQKDFNGEITKLLTASKINLYLTDQDT